VGIDADISFLPVTEEPPRAHPVNQRGDVDLTSQNGRARVLAPNKYYILPMQL
jgi:hypothetical protein